MPAFIAFVVLGIAVMIVYDKRALKWLFLGYIALTVSSCAFRSADPKSDLESISEDVLKAKQGIHITIEPEK